MKELKAILTKMANDLERNAVATYVLGSGLPDKQKARDIAYSTNKDFYQSLRDEIDALREDRQ